jgi:TetR/AcrR family tetracycline transcriptional repressor
MMASPPRKSRPGPRRTLTQEEILEATLNLLDEGGMKAASIRGIAARVGVAPNAVYTYFPDKAAVVQAIVEHLLGLVDHAVFADRDVPWRQRIEALALELRERLTAHPGAVNLMIGGPMNGPHALALNERLMGILVDTGLTPEDAAKAAYLLIVYVFGSIALEVADSGKTHRLPPEAERITARQAGFSAIPAGTHPLSAAAAGTMAGYISTDQYIWGLRKVLDGIAAGLASEADTSKAFAG